VPQQTPRLLRRKPLPRAAVVHITAYSPLGSGDRPAGREQQTLEALARGGGNRAIAAALGIAPATMRDYVSSLCKRSSAANRTEVVRKAIALGLIDA